MNSLDRKFKKYVGLQIGKMIIVGEGTPKKNAYLKQIRTVRLLCVDPKCPVCGPHIMEREASKFMNHIKNHTGERLQCDQKPAKKPGQWRKPRKIEQFEIMWQYLLSARWDKSLKIISKYSYF